MIARRTRAVAVALAFALATPLSVRADDVSTPPAAAPRLQGKFIYIYSFLDVRESDFGPRFLDQIDAQLIADLKKGGAHAKVLRFKNSQTGQYYAFGRNVPMRGSMQTSDQVPVNETVRSNLSDEALAGANYRLIIFPSNFEQMGAGQVYQIRFVLIDCATNKTVWQTFYVGKHLTWWKNDEGAQGRAKKLTDEIVAKMTAAGYL